MKSKPLTFAPLLGPWLYSASLAAPTATASCDVDAFSAFLENLDLGNASSASVIYATPVAEGGSSFDPSPPFAYNVTQLPELCAVKFNVRSSPDSSYNFGLFLPTHWNERMMTTGNGGFGGGINVCSLCSLCSGI